MDNVKEVLENLKGLSYYEVLDKITVDEDNGDCCGWADCDIVEPPLYVDWSKLKLSHTTEHDRPSTYGGDDSVTVFNFIFESEEGTFVLGYELSARSCPGWSYCAWVAVSVDGVEVANASY